LTEGTQREFKRTVGDRWSMQFVTLRGRKINAVM
jgi:hypothetical protein